MQKIRKCTYTTLEDFFSPTFAFSFLFKYFIYTESNSPSNNVSILAENGTYFAHEGSEFVSSACIDSISHMTHILGVRRDEDNKKLFVNVAQLYDLGFDLMAFLSENTHSDYTVLLNESKKI